MEKIAFIVERLNGPPFRKGLNTLTEFDGKTSLELLDLMCEIVTTIDPEQESIYKEATEARVHRIIQFLQVMKFTIPEEQFEDFQGLLLNGDKEILHTIMHWCLQRFDHLQKRAYLAKYLMPVDVPPDFMGDELILELMETLKQLQAEFKEVHKSVEQVRSTGARPSELKAEIQQLEQERTQLENKIRKMQKDMNVDEDYFKEMLKATSALRKEQETEVLNQERLRDHRRASQEADMRFSDAGRRLTELKKSGVQNQSAEQILNKLHQDVRDLAEKRDAVDRNIADREIHLEKLQSWDNNDRMTTEEDVRAKRDQVRDLEDQLQVFQERLDAALERNTKLVVFRQASTIALKKFREREDEVEKLAEELKRIQRQIDEKESENRETGKANSGRPGKQEIARFSAAVKQKIDVYKRMKDELSTLRSELVVLQRTEQILKSRTRNLDEAMAEIGRRRSEQGFRGIGMSDSSADADPTKGESLDELNAAVENIGREFRNKQAQLQPLINQLKATRTEYIDVESQYQERKGTYDKVAVGLDMEKQSLEKECDSLQEESLREESRYHHLQNMIAIAKIKIEKAEQEKKWQNGHGKMLPEFASLKQLYESKLSQQDNLTKQLRKRQKELKENSGALTNQKSNFLNLQTLLTMKLKCLSAEMDGLVGTNRNNGAAEIADFKNNSSYDDRGYGTYPEASATFSNSAEGNYYGDYK